MKIKEKCLGKDHPNYALALNNLGSIYLKFEKNEEALSAFDKCLEIKGKFLGKDHPDYAKTLNNIGAVYGNLGRYE